MGNIKLEIVIKGGAHEYATRAPSQHNEDDSLKENNCSSRVQYEH